MRKTRQVSSKERVKKPTKETKPKAEKVAKAKKTTKAADETSTSRTIISTLNAKDMQGKIVYIQVLGELAKNVPGTFRFIGPDPLMGCGNDEYAVVECIKSPQDYVVGTQYYAAMRRLSLETWEFRAA